MIFSAFIEKLKNKKAVSFAALIAVYFWVLVFNDGFMASDEYWTAMTRYLPASTSSMEKLVGVEDVKSPLQILPMHAVAQLIFHSGGSSALSQYHGVIFILGLINFLLLLAAARIWTQLFPKDSQGLLWLFAFYFAAPFALSRPMFESMAAPWLALSVAWGTRYDLQGKRTDLLAAVAAVSMAFVLRPQTGFCALVLILLPLLKKKSRDVLAAISLGLFLFILSGIPDYFLRGEFHFSLKAVTLYNFEHGHEYGSEPWTSYPLMILALTFSPWFLKSYPQGFFKSRFRDYRVVALFIVFFVFLHSLFPQKFERFLISLIPLFIFVLSPLVINLYNERKTRPWRWNSLLFVNLFLFIPATFYPAQGNILGLAKFLNSHPQFEKVYSVDESITWIPEIFMEKSRPQMLQITSTQLASIDSSDCRNLVILNRPTAARLSSELSTFRLEAEFSVNYLEEIAHRLNPKNNLRRTALFGFACREK